MYTNVDTNQVRGRANALSRYEDGKTWPAPQVKLPKVLGRIRSMRSRWRSNP